MQLGYAQYIHRSQQTTSPLPYPGTMSIRCKGCDAIVKRSGLYPHMRHSRNPQCELYRRQMDDGLLFSNDGSNTATSAQVQVVDTKRSKGERGMDAIMECQSYFIS